MPSRFSSILEVRFHSRAECPQGVEPPRSEARAGRSGNRRNPVVAARSGEGPFTIPFADLAHRSEAGGR